MVTGLLSGSTPAMPSNGFSLVDVRDVAALHVAALQQSTSIGERFLATSDYVSFPEVGCILAAAYPDRAITQKTVPDWIIKIMARFGGVIRQIINISATKNTTTTARAKSCWVGYFCRKKTLSSPAPKVGCDCSRRRRSAADLPARDRPALLRAMHAARLTMVLLIAAAGSACLTPYHPKASPRVQVIDAVGVRTYAKDGVVVVDDFAHHPTAVRTTIEGAKKRWPDRPLWALFEPRSATSCRKIFQDDYARAFDAADKILLAPPGRALDPELALDVPQLAVDLVARGKDAVAYDSIDELVLVAKASAARGHAGAVLLCMSNGAFGGIHLRLLEALQASTGTGA